MKLKQNKIIVILGRKGTGKTTLAKKIISLQKRIFIIDVLDEYDGLDCQDMDLTYFFKNERFRLKIVPDEKFDLDSYLDKLWKFENYYLVLDEIGIWQSPNYISTKLLKFIRLGRHKNINMIMIGRRPAEIHRDITALADEFYFFQIREPRDIEYVKAYISADEKFIDEIRKLQKYIYMKYDVNQHIGEIFTMDGILIKIIEF